MNIQVKKILYKNRFRIGIYFPNKSAENSIAQKIGALYSKTFRCWHLPYDKESYQLVQKAFKNYTVEVEISPVTPVLQLPEEPAPTIYQILKKKLMKQEKRKWYHLLILEFSIRMNGHGWSSS